jgi:hypothetical protein
MDRRRAITVGLSMVWRAARAAPEAEPLAVFAEHPRLLLTAQRLRLLRRERERQSARWQQFEALVRGNAPMPEPAFAYALYYRICGDEEIGRKAVLAAASRAADTRQTALVFDWCQDLLTKPQTAVLTAKLERALAEPFESTATVAAVRSRVMASIALFDHVQQAPSRALERSVRGWWDGQVVPALESGGDVIARDDAYPLFEMLHAVRDTTNVDMRDADRQFFRDYPIEHLITHYPASYPAAENEYRIGASTSAGEPDLRLAALSRAAEMAMVAYDVNAPSSQVLQGWLMHDRFVMRGAFGAPYEFLWANPYQPGLSYFHVPLVYYNPDFGKLFVRSSWEEGATWFGYFGRNMQLFRDGRITVLNPQLKREPLPLEQATVVFGQNARRFQLKLQEDEEAYLVGLNPRQMYLIEVDNEEAFEAPADPGGVMPLDLPRKVDIGFRLQDIDVRVPARKRRDAVDERTRPPRPPRVVDDSKN